MRRSLVRFPEPLWLRLREHCFGGNNGSQEQVAFCYASMLSGTDREVLLVRDLNLIAQDGLERQSEHFVEVAEGAKVAAVLQARKTGDHLIEVHTHPGSLSADDVEFSAFDQEGQLAFQRYLTWKLPKRSWAALVLGQRSATGVYWRPYADASEQLEIWSVGSGLVKHTAASSTPPVTPRFEHQVAAFGAEGQRALADLRVGVVGLGGLGGAVVQFLAYLGLVNFVLVDPDLVEETNLNRLVGAFPFDVGRPKVTVYAELLKRLNPDCRVEALQLDARDHRALLALADCDVLIGTIDNDGARLVLAELAARCLMPYLDAASDILVRDGEVLEVGGRVCCWWPSLPCLNCRGELDRDEVRASLRSSHETELARRLGYAGGAGPTSPSVVHVNGHVAASLVGELHALVTGWRAPHPYLSYRSSPGLERPRVAEALPGCPVCQGCLGLANLQELSRYGGATAGTAA